MSDEFVGKGFPFPMRINESGSFTLIEGIEELERSMAVVLSTAPGERPFRPAFGCRIWELMFLRGISFDKGVAWKPMAVCGSYFIFLI